MSKKPVVLMILDGYGLNDKKEGNAVAEAKTPVPADFFVVRAEIAIFVPELPCTVRPSGNDDHFLTLSR